MPPRADTWPWRGIAKPTPCLLLNLSGVPAWPFRPRKGAAGHRGAGGRHAPPRQERHRRGPRRPGGPFAPLWGARFRGGGAARRVGEPRRGAPCRADRPPSQVFPRSCPSYYREKFIGKLQDLGGGGFHDQKGGDFTKIRLLGGGDFTLITFLCTEQGKRGGDFTMRVVTVSCSCRHGAMMVP